MKRSDEDIDRLVSDWHHVTATATPPASVDPRRTIRAGSAAIPASLLALVLVAVVAIAVAGRGGPGPAAIPLASPATSDAAVATPAASHELATTPAHATIRDANFELDLTIERDRYIAGEDILAEAGVTYLGPASAITVSHAASPVLFTVQEVGGSRSVGGGMDLPCLHSTWARDVLQSFPWQRSGAYSTSDPTENDLFNQAYLEDGPAGGLRLPAGTWRLRVTLLVTPGPDCGGAQEPMSVDLTIVVDPATVASLVPADPTMPAASPVPTDPSTPAPPLARGPVVRCGRLAVVACEGAIALVRRDDPVGYTGAELIVADDTCPPEWICDRMPAFRALVVLVPEPGSLDGATAYGVTGTGGPEAVRPSQGVDLPWVADTARAGLEVAPGTTLFPVRIAAPAVPGEPQGCPLARIAGTLVETETTGIGLSADGAIVPVEWPFGFAGRRDADGVALVDLGGSVVGRVGEPFEGAGQPGSSLASVCDY